jgi:hypothetical protein
MKLRGAPQLGQLNVVVKKNILLVNESTVLRTLF